MNSLLLDGCKIGKNTMIGSGSLVPEGKEIPEGVLAFGRPAKVIRDLTQKEIEFITALSHRYVSYIPGFDFNEVK